MRIVGIVLIFSVNCLNISCSKKVNYEKKIRDYHVIFTL